MPRDALRTSGIKKGESADEIVQLALANVGIHWTADGCTDFAWGIANLAGIPFFDLRNNTTNGDPRLPAVLDLGYVVPHKSGSHAGPDTSGDGWATQMVNGSVNINSVATLRSILQPGDIVRVYGASNSGETSERINGVFEAHEFIVVSNSGGTIEVVDNWSTASFNASDNIVEHSFDDIVNAMTSNGAFYSAYVSRIDSSYVGSHFNQGDLQGHGYGSAAIFENLEETNQADLLIDNLMPVTTTITQGTGISFSAQVRNAGSAAITGDFKTIIYLSSGDKVFNPNDPNDHIIETLTRHSLDAGDTFSIENSVPLLNIPVGNYYLGIYTDFDDVVDEPNEENNSFAYVTQISITASPPPDDFAGNSGTTGTITAGGAQVLGNIEAAGDQDWFKVQVTKGLTYVVDLVNGAVPQPTPFLSDPQLYLYNSSSQQISSNDDANGNYNSELTFKAGYDGYYYVAAAGHANALGTYRLSVSAGSGSSDGEPPRLISALPADNTTNVAVGTNVSLNFSESVKAGSGSIVIHDATTGNAVATISVNDPDRVSFSGTTMTVNPSSDLAPGGHYYVTMASGVVTDLAGNAYGGIASATELDFTTAGTSTSLPDLTLENLEVAVRDGGLSVYYDVRNIGKAPSGNFDIDVYLSSDSQVDSGDFVWNFSQGSLSTVQRVSSSTKIPLPYGVSVGNYYVIVSIDHNNNVAEVSKVNNSQSMAVVLGTPSPADLYVDNLSVSSATLNIGDTLTADLAVSNRGGTDSPGFSTRYYLSTDTKIDASDIVLGTVSDEAVAVGNGRVMSNGIVIAGSISAGQYYLIASADYDNRIAEINEANNVSNPVQITIKQSAHLGNGDGGPNNLTGSDGPDIISGKAGNDTLNGLAGDDVLDGGTGADKMSGGTGNDTYSVENAGDVVIENASEGIDTVKTNLVGYTLGANVENLILTGSGNINGTGNDLNNVLTGNGADNTLLGGRGDDTLNGGKGNDVLNGGTGFDRMNGGAGDDTYYYGSGDSIVEPENGGTDLVMSAVAYYHLGPTLENVTLYGAAAFNADGNNLNNVMTGNANANILQGGNGNDTINGLDGNDTLNGGKGADILTGGPGHDTFVYRALADSLANAGTTASSYDRITDLGAGDILDLHLIDADVHHGGDQAFHQVAAFTGHEAEMTLIYDAGSNTTWLSVDANGDKRADMIVLITGNHTDPTGWLL